VVVVVPVESAINLHDFLLKASHTQSQSVVVVPVEQLVRFKVQMAQTQFLTQLLLTKAVVVVTVTAMQLHQLVVPVVRAAAVETSAQVERQLVELLIKAHQAVQLVTVTTVALVSILQEAALQAAAAVVQVQSVAAQA
jgi:hypothetical protein